MNYTLKFLIVTIVAFSFTVKVNAQSLEPANSDNNSTSTTPKTDKVVKNKSLADKELDKRIDELNSVSARIKEIKNLGDTEKMAMTTYIDGLIGNLSSLRSEIENATSTDSIKTIRETIQSDYRVYALVMPQLNIIAAADRITTMVSMMSIVGSKLENRIGNLSSTTPVNVTLATKTLQDLKNNLIEAQKLAQEAITAVIALVPDQGEGDIKEKNLIVMKDSRLKIKNAQTNLVASRKNAEAIVKLLKKDPNLIKNATSTASSN